MKSITLLTRILAVIVLVTLPMLGTTGCAVHLRSLPGHHDEERHEHEDHGHGHGHGHGHRKHHKHHKKHKEHHGDIVVIVEGHVHTDYCGHYCCGDDWFLLAGHVHGRGCGHEFVAGLWIVP